MNYKIQSHPEMILAGYKARIDPNNAFEVIPRLWSELPKEKYDALAKLNNRPPKGLIGGEKSTGDGQMDYYIAVATEEAVPEGMDTLEIQPGTWAIFEVVGAIPGAIQSAWKEIRKGFTHEEYVWADHKPDMEIYPGGDTQAADYKSYIWLPIRPHWAENRD